VYLPRLFTEVLCYRCRLGEMITVRASVLLAVAWCVCCSSGVEERVYRPNSFERVPLGPGRSDTLHAVSFNPYDGSAPYTLLWIAPWNGERLGLRVEYDRIKQYRLEGTDRTISDAGPGFYALLPDGDVEPLELRPAEIARLGETIRSARTIGDDELLATRVLPQVHRRPPCAQPPPDRERLADAWVTIGEDYCGYRLELRATGDGNATRTCRLYGTLEVARYEIEEWTVDGREFKAQLRPLDTERPAMQLTGTACEGCLFLENGEPRKRDSTAMMRFYRADALERAAGVEF